jgi:hypothetical protein
MYKKIEIWILYLVLVFVFISYIVFGALVRREIMKGSYIPIISPISKIALFIAEIPKNFKSAIKYKTSSIHKVKDRYPDYSSGFTGEPNRIGNKYILIARFDGNLNQSVVDLIDLNTFKTLHTWNPNYNEIFSEIVSEGQPIWSNLMINYHEGRMLGKSPMLLQNGDLLIRGQASPLMKIDKNSNLIIALHDQIYHHSIEKDIDGNFWVCVRYPSNESLKDYSDDIKDEGIRKVSPEGEILFDMPLGEIFIENKMSRSIINRGDLDKINSDLYHINDIQPVDFDSRYWKKGDLFFSLREQSKIYLYRPSTNKIIHVIDGPFYYQHDVDVIDESRISIFNNNLNKSYKGRRVDHSNQVIIYNFELNKFTIYNEEGLLNNKVKTITAGQSEIMPDGDLFVEESNYGRILYFDSNDSLRWVYMNKSEVGEAYKLGWSRILYKNEDIAIVNNFLQSIAK